jgi:hypothetical protein
MVKLEDETPYLISTRLPSTSSGPERAEGSSSHLSSVICFLTPDTRHLKPTKIQQPGASDQTQRTTIHGQQTLFVTLHQFTENHQFLHILGALA